MKLLITTQKVDKNDPILGFFHRWIEEFAKHFERIDVICLQEGEHTLPPHVYVHSLGKEMGENRLKYLLRFYHFFWQLYIRQGVDFVFFHMGAIYNILAAPFFFIRKFKKTKFFWWKTHGHIDTMGRLALAFVDRVYTATSESFPIRSKKRNVIGHAIDTDLFKPGVDGNKDIEVLFVGRISRRKRVEQVFQVVQELKKNRRKVSARIVGAQIDTSYVEELKEEVAQRDIIDEVTFVNGIKQEELVSEYQKAEILINPSDTDGLDKVVLEAMATYCVPVTGNVACEAMLSPYGLFTKKGDIDGYTKTIEQIFDMPVTERLSLQQALREIVVRDHAIQTLHARIFNIS